jgi:hypothetical protein
MLADRKITLQVTDAAKQLIARRGTTRRTAPAR